MWGGAILVSGRKTTTYNDGTLMLVKKYLHLERTVMPRYVPLDTYYKATNSRRRDERYDPRVVQERVADSCRIW
jgi:hypothetical protein